MGTYVAMLRGVNVSGQRPVQMERLRARFDALGHTDVVTYLQSGNVVFSATRGQPALLGAAISRRIAKDFGFDVPVLVRTKRELEKVTAGNPLAARGVDPAHLHVTFLQERPTTAAVRTIDAPRFVPETFTVVGREVFLRCPNGYGRAKLNNSFFERALGTVATTRSWKTVTALVDLAGGR